MSLRPSPLLHARPSPSPPLPRAVIRRPAAAFSAFSPFSAFSTFSAFSALSVARRFVAAGQRAPTFAEISESCAVLGVDVQCDAKHLKKVYRDLVKKNHPDAGGDASSMSRITVAYNRLAGLSKFEKEQFNVQRNAYRGGSYYNTPAAGSHRRGGSRSYAERSGASHYPGGGPYNNGSTQGFYDTSMNSDYFRQESTSYQGYYNYRQSNREYTQNPFSSKYPFSIHAQLQRAWMMPMGSLFIRGFVAYLVLSIFLLATYRKYRDWQHDDGWKMSESLARHEQLSELHRIRQAMNERLRADRDALASQRGFVGQAGGSARDYNAALPPNRELQALEYARRRQIEINESVKGWPRFSADMGKLIHRAQDPPGIVFFEPRREDALSRQVENMRKGRQISEAALQPRTVEIKEVGPASSAQKVDTVLPAASSAKSAEGVREDDTVGLIRNIFGEAFGLKENSDSKTA